MIENLDCIGAARARELLAFMRVVRCAWGDRIASRREAAALAGSDADPAARGFCAHMALAPTPSERLALAAFAARSTPRVGTRMRPDPGRAAVHAFALVDGLPLPAAAEATGYNVPCCGRWRRAVGDAIAAELRRVAESGCAPSAPRVDEAALAAAVALRRKGARPCPHDTPAGDMDGVAHALSRGFSRIGGTVEAFLADEFAGRPAGDHRAASWRTAAREAIVSGLPKAPEDGTATPSARMEALCRAFRKRNGGGPALLGPRDAALAVDWLEAALPPPGRRDARRGFRDYALALLAGEGFGSAARKAGVTRMTSSTWACAVRAVCAACGAPEVRTPLK